MTRLLENTQAQQMWKKYCGVGAFVQMSSFLLAVKKYVKDDLKVDAAALESLFADDFEAALAASVDTNHDKSVRWTAWTLVYSVRPTFE